MPQSNHQTTTYVVKNNFQKKNFQILLFSRFSRTFVCRYVWPIDITER